MMTDKELKKERINAILTGTLILIIGFLVGSGIAFWVENFMKFLR